jgi:hypothetical protein
MAADALAFLCQTTTQTAIGITREADVGGERMRA